MRVLVLHSDVSADAPPDELDTLAAAAAVGAGLGSRGHTVERASFHPDPAGLRAAVRHFDVVFNLVESVHGDGMLAAIAPAMLEKSGIPYTGAGAAALAVTADKILSKNMLRGAGLPTADWAEPPDWKQLNNEDRYIVKAVTEDASVGLDDGAVVGGGGVRTRAADATARHGGRWFAERYLDGREFNVALLQDDGDVRVLPIPEMCFENWTDARPRIVGYAAKWDDASQDARNTVRAFGIEEREPALANMLAELARATFDLLGLRGYARVDFRLDENGKPMILEANPNPCLEPGAGFAAASLAMGLSYPDLLERILTAALRR